MTESFSKKLSSTAIINIMTAAINMLSTILLTRWFGAGVFADYVIDLAYLSLLLILLELVPSAYMVYRVQEQPHLLKGVASISLVTAVILSVVIILLGELSHLFKQYSIWMSIYIGFQCLKRFFDIRLQSDGRLKEFLGIELMSSIFRLILMWGAFAIGMSTTESVWGSLALGVVLAQILWSVRNPSDLKVFIFLFDTSVWLSLLAERHQYFRYYLSVFLKRIRDNLVSVMGGFYFTSREVAGSFFLLYRGLVFASGQIRIFEGMLSHRKTLSNLEFKPASKLIVVSLAGQILCLSTSYIITTLAGIDEFPILSGFLLSTIIWMSVLYIYWRAAAYSRYQLRSVNLSMAAYIITMTMLVTILQNMKLNTDEYFIVALVIAEGCSLLIMYFSRRS